MEPALRVRVGINYCTDVNPRYDPVRRYCDYLGPGVNIAACVESKAQTLLTGLTLDALGEDPRFVVAELPLSHDCFRADVNDTDDSPKRGLCAGPTLPETTSVERVGFGWVITLSGGSGIWPNGRTFGSCPSGSFSGPVTGSFPGPHFFLYWSPSHCCFFSHFPSFFI